MLRHKTHKEQDEHPFSCKIQLCLSSTVSTRVKSGHILLVLRKASGQVLLQTHEATETESSLGQDIIGQCS